MGSWTTALLSLRRMPCAQACSWTTASFSQKICKAGWCASGTVDMCPEQLMTSEVFQTVLIALSIALGLTFDVHVKCHLRIAQFGMFCACLLVVCFFGIPSGGGETGSPPPQVPRLLRHLRRVPRRRRDLHLRPPSSQQRRAHRRRRDRPFLLTTTASTLRFPASSTAVLRLFMRSAFFGSHEIFLHTMDGHFSLEEETTSGRFLDNVLDFNLIGGL